MMRRSGLRLLLFVLFLSGVFAEAGLYYCLTVAKGNIMNEQRVYIESLIQTVDHNLKMEFDRNALEVENLLQYNEYTELEEEQLERGNYDILRGFLEDFILSENNKLIGVTAFYHSEYLFSTFENGESPVIIKELSGAAIIECGGTYYIAIKSQSVNGVIYYTFFDMESFIEDMFGEKVLKNNWLVAYNEESGLLFQNHYDQEQVLFLTKEEMIAREDGYSVIAAGTVEHQIKDQVYQYSTLEDEKLVDNRIIVYYSEILENDYFTLAIAQNSAQLYDGINMISRWSIICLGIIVVSAFGCMWLVFLHTINQYKKNLEANARFKDSQMRLQLAMQQMQPHFLYNSLSAIREIILENPERASDLVYDFTVHLRNCIRMMANNELVPFTKEMENIQAYVSIEEARFDESFTMIYNVEDGDVKVPPLSVQPFVENAIRHGIFELEDRKGEIRVEACHIPEGYRISVIDNGTGFDYKKTMEEIESGVRDSSGLKTSIERIEEAVKGIVRIQSQPGAGTRVDIFIPDFINE